MRPQEYYQAGNLQQAIAAAKEEVRKSPADTAKRGFLAELLAIAGDLEGADRQLDTLVSQQPEAAVSLALVRQLVRAEQARRQFYSEGRVPELLGLPSAALKLHLEASILVRDGKLREAGHLLEQAEEQRPKVSGTCDGKPFTDLRDLDDLNASFFEVLTSTGKYYWVAMEQIELIEFRAPTRPKDLFWLRAHMIVRDGPDGEVYLPTIYAGTDAETDDRIRLGRATEWRGGDGEPVRGRGQRTFLIGEEARAILEIKEITCPGPTHA
jgi:type VI secretion system protein ImpE